MQIKSFKEHSKLQVVHRNDKLGWMDAIADLRSLVQDLENKIVKQDALNQESTITIKTGGKAYFIPINQILYCEAHSNYSRIHLLNGKPLFITKTLKTLEIQIGHQQFIRCHQSFLVNRSQILRYERNRGMTLVMSNQKVIPVARRKVKWLLNSMQ